MNEDYGPVLGKYKVWFTRQTLVMEKKTKASCMQASPDDQFRFCIFTADTRHHPAPRLG